MVSVGMIRSYIICATPRSGSNLLCEILSSLGFVGEPQEHLWEPPGTESAPLALRWPQVIYAGTGDNGVFGLKLMWYQAQLMEKELPEILGMRDESLAGVLAVRLGDPQYFYLTRRDHVRQAISLVRAMQSEQWRSMDPSAREPQYDATAIAEAVRFLEQDEADWEDFFQRNSISPHRLMYEDLDAAPHDTVTRILLAVRYPGTRPVTLPPPRHRRQADGVTEEWRRRYAGEYD